MKLLMEPLQVELFFEPAAVSGRSLLHEGGLLGGLEQAPAQLCWRGARYRVLQVLGWWKYRGRWWIDPHLEGERRCYYRLLCRRSLREAPVVMEVFAAAAGWVLSRMAD
jgi:Family of unknown function (DUF6504)